PIPASSGPFLGRSWLLISEPERSVRVHGVVCFTGMLSNQWTVRDFYPRDHLPRGVRLAAYKGPAAYLPPRILQDFLDAVAAGTAAVPIGHVYRFDQIV